VGREGSENQARTAIGGRIYTSRVCTAPRFLDIDPDATVRFQRRPAVADLGDVPPHELVDAVINGAEEPVLAFLDGVEASRIGAPSHPAAPS
jgi:hypothetical protein